MYPMYGMPTLQQLIEQHEQTEKWIKQLKADALKPPKPWGFSIPEWLKISFLFIALSPFVGPVVLKYWEWGWHQLPFQH
jgi:hypothetical protein